MDSISSMNSLRDDTATSARIGKSANAQRGDDQERGNVFGDLLASLIAPTVLPAQPVIQPQSQQVPAELSISPAETATSTPLTIGTEPANTNSANAPKTDGSSTASTTTGSQQGALDSSTEISPETSPTAWSGDVSQGQSEGEAVLAQLTGLSAGDEGGPIATAVQTQAKASQVASPSVTTNAATLSASRSNVGVAAATQNEDEAATSAQSATQTTSSPAASSTPVSNDNAALIAQTKPKSVDIDTNIKTPGQPLEPVSTTLDGAGSTSVISGQEVAVPANDQASRAPQLTPQTIPMLAATMMRRLESGAKQFTMRLDPAELGQVEVKLTVAADKKVRAVVSAERPEALADLVRSARELIRALAEAGLDLEENGLTFQMNDPSSGGRQQEARDHQSAAATFSDSNLSLAAEAEIPVTANKANAPSDPFERWQRARIVLTA